MSLLNDPAFQAHVAATAEKFNVPGLGIALVDLARDQVASKGFSFVPGENITGDTVLQIYSNTKLFTTVAYGILVEEGKCRWDSKLCDLLPNLRLRDEQAQRTLTVEEVLSHQSGMCGHLIVESLFDSRLKDVVEVINDLRFLNAPRTGFRYNNIFYALVGHIVSVLSGMPFADFVQSRILAPLGMKDTTWTDPSTGRDVVQGYVTTWEGERVTEKISLPCMELSREAFAAPTGGILSTPSDMSKWLAFLLRLSAGRSTSADAAIISPGTIQEILRSRVIADQQIGALPVEAGSSLWEEMSVPTYGLGQLRVSYRGVDIASHNGTGPGGGIIFVWTPGRTFGICVLTNTLGSVFHAGISIALTALDMHLGRSTLDWNTRLAEQPWAQTGRLPVLPAVPKCGPALPSSVLCGRYTNGSYGDLHIVDLKTGSSKTKSYVSEILRKYEVSKPVGQQLDRRPNLLAVFNKGIGPYIYELYHIEGRSYCSIGIMLAEQHDPDGTVLSVPGWVILGPSYGQFTFVEDVAETGKVKLEYYRSRTDWQGEGEIGRGTATFGKAAEPATEAGGSLGPWKSVFLAVICGTSVAIQQHFRRGFFLAGTAGNSSS